MQDGSSQIPATLNIEGVPDTVSSASIAAFAEAGVQPLLAPPRAGAAATIAVPASICSPLTLQCLVRLLEGTPDEFKPCGDVGDGSDDDTEQRRPAAAPRRQASVPLKTALELFAAAQHLGVMPRLWPCLLTYLQPMLTELAMEEVRFPFLCKLAHHCSVNYVLDTSGYHMHAWRCATRVTDDPLPPGPHSCRMLT